MVTHRGPQQQAQAAQQQQQMQPSPSFPKGMTGLANLGNTCFFNSVCQSLAHTIPLLEYLTDDDTTGRVKGELSIALCVFLRLYQKNEGSGLSPDKLWEMVCRQHAPFQSYSQQDAQELYTFLLVGLEGEYASRSATGGDASPPAPSSPKGGAEADAEGGGGAKKKKKKKVNNIISKIFRGTLESVVLCRGCGARSCKADDYFRDISVEIPGSQQHYLQQHHDPYAQQGGEEALRKQRMDQLVSLMQLEQSAEKRLEQKREDDAAAAVEAQKEAERRAAEDLAAELLQEEAASAKAGKKGKGKAGKKAGKAAQQQQEPASPLPSMPSEGSADTPLVGGLSKKVFRMLQALERQESDLRAKQEREADKALEAILGAHKPRHLAEGVTAVSMKGVQAYSSLFSAGPSLVRCLESFFSPEVMDGKNLYRCGKCKNECEASKQLCIASAPSVLTVHLKRFQQDFNTGMLRKLNGYVSFPLALKLDPYMSSTTVLPSASVPLYDDSVFEKFGEDAAAAKQQANSLHGEEPISDEGKVVYKLYAVVVHSGWLSQGHYYAYVRPYDPKTKSRTDKWFKASDESVSEVYLFEVLAAEAYLLMYERV